MSKPIWVYIKKQIRKEEVTDTRAKVASYVKLNPTLAQTIHWTHNMCITE